MIIVIFVIKNPFRPGSPIEPMYFGGRREEQARFTKALRTSISGNPGHLTVLGSPGIGKSSILWKFEELAKNNGCLVVRRECDTTIESIPALVLFLLESLKQEGSRYTSSSKKIPQSATNFFNNYKVGGSVLGLGFTIEKLKTEPIAQDYLYNELMHVWNRINKNINGIVFLIDEAEKIQQIDGVWGFLRSVFTRLSEQNVGLMFVAAGRIDLYKNIKDLWAPAERFFYPIRLNPMNVEETKETLEKPLAAFSKSIDDGAVDEIRMLSGGSPYIIQNFGFHVFEKGVSKVTKETVREAAIDVISALSAQIFHDKYESASFTERGVLLALASASGGLRPKEVEEISGIKSVSTHLRRLIKKEYVIQNGNRYAVFTPLFGKYVLARAGQNDQDSSHR